MPLQQRVFVLLLLITASDAGRSDPDRPGGKGTASDTNLPDVDLPVVSDTASVKGKPKAVTWAKDVDVRVVHQDSAEDTESREPMAQPPLWYCDPSVIKRAYNDEHLSKKGPLKETADRASEEANKHLLRCQGEIVNAAFNIELKNFIREFDRHHTTTALSDIGHFVENEIANAERAVSKWIIKEYENNDPSVRVDLDRSIADVIAAFVSNHIRTWAKGKIAQEEREGISFRGVKDLEQLRRGASQKWYSLMPWAQSEASAETDAAAMQAALQGAIAGSSP